MPARKSKLKRIADEEKIAVTPSADFEPQSTIIQHFSFSKQSSRGLPPEATPDLPPSKRIKLQHDRGELQDPLIDGPQSMNIENMYNFSNSDASQSSSIIDLTKSPSGGSGRRPINGGVRPPNFTSSRVPRKLVVKNLKRPSGPDPEQYYSDVWSRLEVSLDAIFAESKLPYSKETLYKEVMILCQQNKAESLLAALSERLTNHVDGHVFPTLHRNANDASSRNTLLAVVQAWDVWLSQLEIIRAIFFFLDRSYVLRRDLPSLEAMGIQSFTQSVIQNEHLKSQILQGINDLISLRRSQPLEEQACDELIQRVIKMVIRQGVYGSVLEPELLAETSRFYSQWTKDAIASNDLAGYIRVCETSILREKQNASRWLLDPATSKQIEIYLEDILIVGQKERLLNVNDVGHLLNNDETGLLRQLFMLLQRRELGVGLKPAFEEHIIHHGANIVFDEDREDEMVNRLLTFKRKLYAIWEHAFLGHIVLRNALRGAFESFMNKTKRNNMNWGTDNSKPGEMIAKHVDKVLKGGSKAGRVPVDGDKLEVHDRDESGEDEDAEISKQLDEVLDLFRFVHGKAVFEAFYKRDLARRLLLGRSASSDAEKSMLTRLKTECGAGFTHNLEQMFKDIETARDEITSYKAMLEERGSRPLFDLSVNVLSSAAWPSYPDVMINVPEEVLRSTASFEQYFKVNHSGRKLEWKHALAHCQLRAIFPKGTKEIIVSSFQAIVLLSFNGADTLSYEELKSSSGLDDLELKRTLQSLACAYYRVLSKQPKGKDVNVEDTFSVNFAFHHPKYRIKINQIQAKETRQENQQTHERIAIDRKYETQAAIVRIMKGRKSITHAELVSETIIATRTRGPLDPADIKTQIEKLIEKDYMEREDDEPNTYTYVA